MNRLKLSIKGYSIDYFLKELLKLKINIYYIDKKHKELIVIIDSSNLGKVLNIKSSCKVSVLNSYGIIKYKYLIYKYKYVFIFFLISLLVFFYLSNLVFDIKVYGTSKKVNNELYSYMNKYKYRLMTYDFKNKVKEKIIKNNKDISFIEIKKDGTLINIYYKERKRYKEKKSDEPRNIVAKKDGIILKVEADEGEIRTVKDAYVREGDILIDGNIKNKDDVVKKVRAKGRVIAEVWYKVKISVPKVYKNTKYINLNKRCIYLSFLNNDNYKNSKILLSDITFPINIKVGDKYKKIIINKVYKDEDVLKLVENKFEKDSIIDKKVLKKYPYNSKIVYEIFIRKKEDIGKYEEIK